MQLYQRWTVSWVLEYLDRVAMIREAYCAMYIHRHDCWDRLWHAYGPPGMHASLRCLPTQSSITMLGPKFTVRVKIANFESCTYFHVSLRHPPHATLMDSDRYWPKTFVPPTTIGGSATHRHDGTTSHTNKKGICTVFSLTPIQRPENDRLGA